MIIELDKLTKCYGEITALDDLTLGIEPGLVGLLGPNGAGKTTLLNLLLGHTEITRGDASVLGFDVRQQARAIRRRLGCVPENDCFIPGLSGVGYVQYVGRLAGMDRHSAMQRTHEMLDLVGLEDERYRPVETYSAGMKQRVKWAQALVHDPDLVFLDEPTNGMDPPGRRRALELIRDLGKRGVAVILSSHLLHDVEQVCERVIVLGRGRVLAEGRIEEMRRPSPRRCEVRVRGDLAPFQRRLTESGVKIYGQDEERLHLELPADDRHDLVVAAVAQSGVQLRELRLQRSSLEEVFLQAVASQEPAGGKPTESPTHDEVDRAHSP